MAFSSVFLPFENKKECIDFTALKTSDYLPSLEEALTLARARLKAICESTDPASFENTLVALESCADEVEVVSTTFFNLLHADTNDELQALAKTIAPKLADFRNDILLNERLFERIKAVYDNKVAHDSLTSEERELLEKVYSDFSRNGARLSKEKKEELRAIDSELSKLGPQFSENVLKSTNEFLFVATSEEEVDGLPEPIKEGARALAEERGHQNAWAFTLHAPSYIPFMQYASHRPSREKIFRAFNSRAFGGKYDNQQTILRILALREKRAQLLGYPNHAAFVLEKRMAESPQKVQAFLKRLVEVSLPAAKEDVAMVEEFARESGAPMPLMPWDFSYYSEKLKEKLFQFKSEDLRPYFPLDKVVNGLFEHARRLYGLKFTETKDVPVYHRDVRVFRVESQSTGEFIGLFYTDFFPRDSKNAGAWMTNYVEQGLFFGKVRRPHVAIVCNFTKPAADRPSLLTFDEVETAFHEFGHSLHSLLSRCKYRSLSGTNVYWDFVELPSQIMENWVLEKESLDLFAEHYRTGEKIPAELTDKIKQSSRFLAGYMSLRQCTFATLDMAYYTTSVREISDVSVFEEKSVGGLRVMPKVDGTNFSCGFSHIFAGGYSAGYYSYKWAEVLDADAFEMFREKGLFDSETARKFRENILERGGTAHPMELYKKFRGREPDADALLRRDGLI